MPEEDDKQPEARLGNLPQWPEGARDTAPEASTSPGWLRAMRWGAVGGLVAGSLPVLFFCLTVGQGHSTGGVPALFYPLVFGIGGAAGFVCGFIAWALLGRSV